MKINISESDIEAIKDAEACKEELDILRSRLFLLRGRDKIIMTMYIEKGISCRKIALFLGVNATSVLRRIKKIEHILTKGIYVSCLKNKERFTPGEMKIATDYFLNELSMREIARKRKTSFYKIYQKIKEIQHTANNL
jgi:predicted DNA-binding protein YlxM (UPF0122 family)